MRRITLALCLLAVIAGAHARTWTFRRDGQIQDPGGATSFRKGGRINADLVRVDGTNVILRLALNGKDGAVPLDCLSDADRAYLGAVKNAPAPPKEARDNEVTNYIKANAADLVHGVGEEDFPKSEPGAAACKDIVSELQQVARAVEGEISYERFGALLDQKMLAVEKAKDTHEDVIPGVFVKHVDLCLKKLNRSKRYWKEEIKADDKDSKAFYAYMKRGDWEESTIDLLYCAAIAQKDPGIMQKIFEQKALIIQHEQAAIKASILADSGLPLLPPMTQEEIVSQLKSSVEWARASGK
jgi:hypothetical protein